MNLKKFIAILLTLVMVVGLVACGGKSKESTSVSEATPATSESETSEKPADEKPADEKPKADAADAPTLVWWLIGNTHQIWMKESNKSTTTPLKNMV